MSSKRTLILTAERFIKLLKLISSGKKNLVAHESTSGPVKIIDETYLVW